MIKNQFGVFSALGMRPKHSGKENEKREKKSREMNTT